MIRATLPLIFLLTMASIQAEARVIRNPNGSVTFTNDGDRELQAVISDLDRSMREERALQEARRPRNLSIFDSRRGEYVYGTIE